MYSLHAQPYYFKHLQVEDGLSNNTAICTLQDSKGFLWFGTKDGLNRYDGYTFKIYRNNPSDSNSIGNNSIWRLYEDEKGTLWVGTERGLFSFDYATERFTLLKDAPQAEISGITTDKEGNLWFLAGFKVHRYTPATKNLERFDNTKELSFCVTITRSQKGEIWIGNISGELLRFNSRTNTFNIYNVFWHSPPSSSGWIDKIYDTGLGFFFVGTSSQGVKKFNPDTGHYEDILTYNDDNTEIYVRDFIQNKENEFWIATESGIYIYDLHQNSFQHLKKNTVNPYALSDNAVYSFAKDREGGIWACTYFGGINYYSNQNLTFEKFFYIPGTNTIQGNAVREIIEDPWSNIWIGTEDAGLNILNPATGKFTTLSPKDGYSGLTHTNIHGLMIDGDHLWIGTFEHGLDIMDMRTRKVIKHFAYGPGPYELKSNFIHSVFKTSNNRILVGTSNGIYLYNRQQQNFRQLDFLPSGFYSAITEDANGNVWLGTFKNGVYYYNPELGRYGRLKYLQNGTDRLEKNRVTYTYIDSNHQLWICTEDGLFCINLKTQRIRSFSTANGLPSNLVYCVIEDNEQFLWITTSKGLVRMNPHTGVLNIFTQANGLLSDQFNYSSAFKDRMGRIYFGSVKGMIRFDPSQLNTPHIVPPVYITSMQVNNIDVDINSQGPLQESLLNTPHIRLNYMQSSLSFDFAALYYTSPQNIEYAYKLEGVDKDWNYIKTNRRVYFTNLSPGIYRFVVKSTDSKGNWANNEKSLTIEILPPWWLSKLAYTVYILLGILAVYIVIMFYHNRQKEKQKIQMALFERAKEKEAYESKIEFFTSIAHEIRTPLTLIRAPMEKIMNNIGQVPQVEKYLRAMDKNTQRLLELTNQLLDFRKVESGEFSLNKEQVNITELLQTLHVNFLPLAERKQINFQLSIPSKNAYAYLDEDATIKIISNLIDNAIKYCKSSVNITLRTSYIKKEVIITITNDGQVIPPELQERVFEPFFRTPHGEKITGSGIGLSLAKSLAELLGGTIVLHSADGINIFTLHLPLDAKS